MRTFQSATAAIVTFGCFFGLLRRVAVLKRLCGLQRPPLVGVLELADNSVNLTVRVWTKAGDYFATKLALTENIKLAFDEAGITIPYPQVQVHTANSHLANSDRSN